MKTRRTLMLFGITALLATLPMASYANPQVLGATQRTDTVYPGNGNVYVRQVVFTGSDAPAIGDPLGNHPVTAKDNQGPLITRQTSYDENCQDPACVRAFKRWHSNTTWQQDRASGR